MPALFKVQVYGAGLKTVQVEAGATKGAVFGQSLWNADGTLVTAEQFAFPALVQQDQAAVAARPGADQVGPTPGVEEPALPPPVDDLHAPGAGVDEAGLAEVVGALDGERDPLAVPADQQRVGAGIVEAVVDPPGLRILGVGGDDPDLVPVAAVRFDLQGQPVAVRRMPQRGDRPLDRQSDIAGAGELQSATQPALHRPRVAVDLDQVREGAPVGGDRGGEGGPAGLRLGRIDHVAAGYPRRLGRVS